MMQILDNIERRPAPSAEVLLRDYVLNCQPVILTNLFDDQPIRAFDTCEKLRAAHPHLPIAVRPNYLTTAMGADAVPERMTLTRFLEYVETHPGTDNICIEHPTPPDLAALVQPTSHCRVLDEEDLRSLIFLAAAGNFVHLHIDGDQRHTLMYQAFGRKRYVIIDTREVGKIFPRADRNSSISLENFSVADKLAFLRYTNAWDCVLEPGETLLIPMLAWHYVEYVDVSMSVSFRLGRNRYNRFLAESVPVASPFLQRVGRAFVDESRLDAQRAAQFARLEAVSRLDHQSAQAQAEALDRCCMEICDALDPEGAMRPYTIADIERRRTLNRVATEPAESAEAPAPKWEDQDAVALRPGVLVLLPLAGEATDHRAVVFARYGRLELSLTIDERRPWLFELLRLLSCPDAAYRVVELAAACGVSPIDLRAVLTELHDRGWLISDVSLEAAPV